MGYRCKSRQIPHRRTSSGTPTGTSSPKKPPSLGTFPKDGGEPGFQRHLWLQRQDRLTYKNRAEGNPRHDSELPTFDIYPCYWYRSHRGQSHHFVTLSRESYPIFTHKISEIADPRRLLWCPYFSYSVSANHWAV